MDFKHIVVEHQGTEAVALIRLNRPKQLNALNLELMDELAAALHELDNNAHVRVMVLTGNDQAFAAGADVTEMVNATALEMDLQNRFAAWNRISSVRKPIIAAVSGYVLGGGCELMLSCDMVVASETVRIGQPEIKLGVMPGAGGTQRLTRAIGKALAMELILTGRMMTADEALRLGLLNRVVPVECYLDEAMRLAKQVAEFSPIALMLAKQAVNHAFNSFLDEGLLFERKNFSLCFTGPDQKEGMQAFLEKRPPRFNTPATE
ncbi:MAG: enoyl-CoA hydratase-related protein [Chitinophagales bacterium]|nr:enoyl-CoA hydratase-related protein [Chitinophagales bacterium]MDW8427844.1 enoyl-CoA hydratase-related protein [Chitinophagales bacterium]